MITFKGGYHTKFRNDLFEYAKREFSKRRMDETMWRAIVDVIDGEEETVEANHRA